MWIDIFKYWEVEVVRAPGPQGEGGAGGEGHLQPRVQPRLGAAASARLGKGRARAAVQLHLAPRGLQRHLAAVTRRAGHRDLGPGLLASRGRGLQGGQGGRGGPAQHRSGRGPGRHAPGRGSRHPHLDTRTRLHHHPPRGSTHLVTRARVRQVRHQRRGPARRGEQRARVQRVAAAEGRRRGEQQREAGGRQLHRGHGGGEAGHWGTQGFDISSSWYTRPPVQAPGQLGGVGDLVAGVGAEAAQASGALDMHI